MSHALILSLSASLSPPRQLCVCVQLFLSICAAFAPLSFQDPLLIPKGEKDEPAAGLIPAFVPGELASCNSRISFVSL
jgi:hypothetical protein